MGTVIRRSSYVAIVSYIGFFIGYVNMLWLLPYAFRPEEIGLVRLMLAVATMFTTLASFGGSQIVTKFFPYFSESLPRRTTFIKFFSGFAFFGAAVFFLCFIFFSNRIAAIYYGKSPLFVSYSSYILPLTISLIIYNIIEAFVIVQGRPLVPTLLREVYTRIGLTIASIVFIVTTFPLSGFFSLLIVFYCLAPVLLFFYGNREHLLPLLGPTETIKRIEFREMAKFGIFIFLGNASATVLTNIDSVVLSAYSGLTSTGIYGIALVIAVIIDIPKRSLSQVLIPLVVKANKEQDIRTLDGLYKKSSLNQFIIGVAIFLIIWLNIDGIFSLIPNGHIYSEGKWVVLFISLAKLYDMITGINEEIIGTSRYYRIYILIYFILSIVGVGLNFLLIPSYGLNGAAYAVFASVFLYNTMRFIFIALVMKIQPFTKNTLVAGICALLTYLIISIVPSFHGAIIDIGLRTLFIGAIFGILILGFRVSEDISQTFKKIIMRFYSRR